MDQAVIAGIGNIYSDEILFQAGIHPRTRADRLTIKGEERLISRIKEVLKKAVDAETSAESLIDQLPKTFFIPYRERPRCPRCGGEVETVKFSGPHRLLLPAMSPDPKQ